MAAKEKRVITLLDPMWAEPSDLAETEITDPAWEPRLHSLLRLIILGVEEARAPSPSAEKE